MKMVHDYADVQFSSVSCQAIFQRGLPTYTPTVSVESSQGLYSSFAHRLLHKVRCFSQSIAV